MSATASTVVRRDQPVAHYLPGDTPPPTPRVARRSLNAAQRNALKNATPSQSVSSEDDVPIPVQAQQNYDAPEPTTDALGEEPRTIRPRSRSGSATTMAPYQPQKTGFPWKVLLIGTTIPVVLYTVIFLIFTGWIMLTNTLTYGPTHTSYTQATINGELSVIQTSNVNGTIYVTILQAQHDGSIKASTYLGPALDPSAWNGDLRSIVATVEVAKGQQNPTITIHLTGTIGYFHLLFARPTLTFSLMPDKQNGYKIVQS